MRFGPDEFPGPVFERVLRVRGRWLVVLIEQPTQFIRLADVKSAKGIFQHVNPEWANLGIQAPRGGLNSIQGSLNRPLRDWMAYYQRFWDEHLERLEKQLTKRDE